MFVRFVFPKPNVGFIFPWKPFLFSENLVWWWNYFENKCLVHYHICFNDVHLFFGRMTYSLDPYECRMVLFLIICRWICELIFEFADLQCAGLLSLLRPVKISNVYLVSEMIPWWLLAPLMEECYDILGTPCLLELLIGTRSPFSECLCSFTGLALGSDVVMFWVCLFPFVTQWLENPCSFWWQQYMYIHIHILFSRKMQEICMNFELCIERRR